MNFIDQSFDPKRFKSKGFTIVELLIVIVVIGILAAITIVAYNGVQARTLNTQTISVVSSYQKALRLYAIDNSDYPPQSYVCLGSGYPANNCWSGIDGTHNVSTHFDSFLQPYLPVKPAIPLTQFRIVGDGVNLRAGGVYVRGGFRIKYYLQNQNQNCGFPNATGVNAPGSTECTLTLQPL